MGRVSTYLKDRAIVRSTNPTKNHGVITARTAGQVLYEDIGDWIPARLRPVKGDESKEDSRVRLTYTHEIVLYPKDLSGNPVQLKQSDIIDVLYNRNGTLSDRIEGFKIVGVIKEIRKNTKVVSYVLQVHRDTEH